MRISLAEDKTYYYPCPSLSMLLSRSRQILASPSEFESVVFSQFGIKPKIHEDLPIAAVRCFAATGKRTHDWLICIDPVHLQADVADSLLLDNSCMDVSRQEADALIDTLRCYFSEYDFSYSAPNHWHMKSQNSFLMHTQSLSVVSGAYINRSLPVGRDAVKCLKLLTEIQMMLFKHAVNRVREQDGRLLINSVWPYGGGYLPDDVNTVYHEVFSKEPSAIGLARLAGISIGDFPEQFADLKLSLKGKNILLISTDLLGAQTLSEEQIHARLENYEIRWFQPVLEAIKNDLIDILELDFCDGHIYQVSKSSLRRFWRSTKPWNEFLSKVK